MGWKEKRKVDSYEAITLGRLLAHNDLIPFFEGSFHQSTFSNDIKDSIQGDCREETRRAYQIPISVKKRPFLAARLVLKKKLVVNSEQLFRAVFLCFHGQYLYFIFTKVNCLF